MRKRFSPDPPVSSTNKTERHDITEILLKVALNIIKQTINVLDFLVCFMMFNATSACDGNFSYIVAFSFIGGGNRRIRRKSPTCRKSLTNLNTQCCTPRSDRDSNRNMKGIQMKWDNICSSAKTEFSHKKRMQKKTNFF
jgi:hypothetical protein